MSGIIDKIRESSLFGTLVHYYIPLLLVLMSANILVEAESSYDYQTFIHTSPAVILAAICAFIIAEALYLIIKGIKNKVRPVTNSYVTGLVLALASYLFTETCSETAATKESVMFLLMGPLFIYGFYLLGSVLFKDPRIYFIIITIIFHIYGLFQFYLFEFRGAPLRISDLSSIKSGTTIASEYSLFSFMGTIMLILTAVSITLTVLIVVKTEIKPIKLKIRLCTAVGVVVYALIFGVFGMDLYRFGIENRVISLNFTGSEDRQSFQKTGSALLFYLDAINSRAIKPKGYSEEKALEILAQYEVSDEKPKRTPTVIAIMDESFADFGQIGELSTNKDYMPFIHSMSENTVKGYVTVTAYGGYSCNSEYEFLSGNSMGFFPLGSASYTQYVKNDQDSLVSYFKDLGYTTEAIAGCSSGLWNIGEAYKYIGFDNKLFEKNVRQRAGDDCKKINDRLADEEMFDIAIEEFENKEDGKPMFTFLTTMQNHSPYVIMEDPEITLNGADDPEAEAYMSYAYETDKAVEKLVEYFSNVDEDVVIVFFGDHFPHIPQFSERLLGSSLGSISTEQNAKVHSTPFFIWANYDIEEQSDVRISLNYLSNKLMEVCGTPKTAYQLMLDDIMKSVPSISAFGYRGENGSWYRIQDSSPYEDVLNKYNIVQYYRMFEQYGE